MRAFRKDQGFFSVGNLSRGFDPRKRVKKFFFICTAKSKDSDSKAKEIDCHVLVISLEKYSININ